MQQQYLAAIKGGAETLLNVTNDLLDLSKMEAGKLELDVSEFALRALLNDTISSFAFRAHKKGLELAYHVDSDVPDDVVGDAGRLRQILLNLVSNAIKFAEHGDVNVRVGVQSNQPPEAHSISLDFEISDTGIGIPFDKQQRIFHAFEQAEKSTARRYGGTGLGLSIASTLVGMMGGTIGVQSEPGHGSVFRFTANFGIPFESPVVMPPALASHSHDRPEAPDGAPGLTGLRILLAEDNEFNQEVVQRLLGRKGHVVTTVQNGQEALTTLARESFDLLLLDCYMPEVDGFEVIRTLRQRENQTQARRLPVIALTALSMKGDRERCLDAGMDDYLPKPLYAPDLYATIDRLCRKTAHELPLIDAVALLAGCNGDSALLDKMVQSFGAHAHHHLTQLADAWQQRSPQQLKAAAHKLRGLVSPFSSSAASAVQKLEDVRLEQQWPSSDEPFSRVSDLVAAISEALPRVTIEGLKKSVDAKQS